MDVHTKKTRSYNMSQIKSRGTKPELIVRRICHKLGLRFRLNQKRWGTRPDLVFKKHRAVIFVNGCFWHKHNCKYGIVIPKTNARFWQDKRSATVIRDRLHYSEIERHGWKCIVIWECELIDLNATETKLSKEFQISISSTRS